MYQLKKKKKDYKNICVYKNSLKTQATQGRESDAD